MANIAVELSRHIPEWRNYNCSILHDVTTSVGIVISRMVDRSTVVAERMLLLVERVIVP